MLDPNADIKRRDAMAMAAAPYLNPKLSTVEAVSSNATHPPGKSTIELVFVTPRQPPPDVIG